MYNSTMLILFLLSNIWMQRSWKGGEGFLEYKDSTGFHYSVNLYTEDSLHLGDWGWLTVLFPHIFDYRGDDVIFQPTSLRLIGSYYGGEKEKQSFLYIFDANLNKWITGGSLSAAGINNLTLFKNDLYFSAHFYISAPKIYHSKNGDFFNACHNLPLTFSIDSITAMTSDEDYLYAAAYSKKNEHYYVFRNRNPLSENWERTFPPSPIPDFPPISDMEIISVPEGNLFSNYLYICGNNKIMRLKTGDTELKWEDVSVPDIKTIHGLLGITDGILLAGESKGENGVVYLYDFGDNKWTKVLESDKISYFKDLVINIEGILVYGKAKEGQNKVYLFQSGLHGTSWQERGYLPGRNAVIAASSVGNYFHVLDNKGDIYQNFPVGEKLTIGFLQSSVFEAGTSPAYGKINYWSKGKEENIEVRVKTLKNLDTLENVVSWDNIDPVQNGQDLSEVPSVKDGDKYIVYAVTIKTDNPYESPVLDSISIEYFIPEISFVSASTNKDTLYTKEDLLVSATIQNTGYKINNCSFELDGTHYDMFPDSSSDTLYYYSGVTNIDLSPGNYTITITADVENSIGDTMSIDTTLQITALDPFKIDLNKEAIPDTVKEGDKIGIEILLACDDLNGNRKIDSTVVILGENKYSFSGNSGTISTTGFSEGLTTGYIYGYSNLGEIDSIYVEFIVEKENKIIENLKVYPNPVKGNYINISFLTRNRGNLELGLYTVDGILVYTLSQDIGNPGDEKFIQIPLDRISSGVYYLYLKFTTEEGKKEIYKRTMGVVK